MVNVAFKQHVGKRKNQEDACKLVFQDDQDPASDILMVLADGMGGHAGGEVASDLACKSFVKHFVSDSAATKPRARLEQSLHSANASIGERIANDPDLKGMGCTLIGALKIDNRLSWVSVGDSVVFLFRKGTLSRLNADHSLYGELNDLVRAGKITQIEADAHPRRNSLRAAVMGSPISMVDLEAIELQPDDLIVLATDGLETLSDAEISIVLSKEARPDVRSICSDLVNAVEAKKADNQDNTTVIAFRHTCGERTSSSSAGPWWAKGGLVGARRKVSPLVLIGAAVLVVLLMIVTVWFITSNRALPAPEEAEVAAPSSPGPSQSIEDPSQPRAETDDTTVKEGDAADGVQTDDAKDQDQTISDDASPTATGVEATDQEGVSDGDRNLEGNQDVGAAPPEEGTQDNDVDGVDPAESSASEP